MVDSEYIFLLVFSTVAVAMETSFEPVNVIKEWSSNFGSLTSFSTMVEAVREVNVSRCGRETPVGKKFLRISDLADFVYYGEEGDHYLPHGRGVLVHRELDADAGCINGVCEETVVYVNGTFERGFLHGPARVMFRDGSILIANFDRGRLDGPAAHFDQGRSQRYTGTYSLGHSNPFTSVFVREEDKDQPLEELRDPLTAVRGFDDGLQETSCDAIVRSVALRPGSLHEHALVSAPGSGSKWVASMIDWVTGIRSYGDAIAVATPRYKVGSRLFVKTHHCPVMRPGEPRRRETLKWRMRHLRKFEGRGVLLLRNPYDAIISHWTHWEAGNEIGTTADLVATLKSREFVKFARLEMTIWLDIAFDWLTVAPRLLVVHYESFLTDPVSQLRSIVSFMGLPLSEQRLKCVAKRPSFVHKRPFRPEVSKEEIFPQWLRNEMDEGVKMVQKLLINKGFQPFSANS